MPTFFLTAGFFGAMLYRKKGLAETLRNRARRILLPFVIFWPILYIIVASLMLATAHIMEFGEWGFDLSLVKDSPKVPLLSTMHLWFLYYLLLFYLALAVILSAVRYLAQKTKLKFTSLFGHSVTFNWGLVLVILFTAYLKVPHPFAEVPTGLSFIPSFPFALFYGQFFMFGYLLYVRIELLQVLEKRSWLYLALANMAFLVTLLLIDSEEKGLINVGDTGHIILSFMFASSHWLFAIGLLGLSLKYLKRENKLFRYFTDASYWIYLTHLIFTILFANILYFVEIPSLMKFVIGVCLTFAICTLSYHYLVRNTAVGVLLNGRRYPSKTSCSPLESREA